MDIRHHWEKVYQTKAPNAVSWYAAHLEISLRLIEKAAPDKNASIIDVGGGEATLVDDLLTNGYDHVTVLDISEAAIEVAKQRLDIAASRVTWMIDDVMQAALPENHFDVWHDRAVFHFLTNQGQRSAYVRKVVHAMKSGGLVIVATFGPQGPEKCSGLDVVRYDAESLHFQFGNRFQLIDNMTEIHHTPFGTTQQFLYCLCRVK